MIFSETQMVKGSLLTTTAAIYYTVTTGKVATVQYVSVCNTAGTSTTFRLHYVPPSGSAGPDNAKFYDVPLSANETLEFSTMKYLFAGDTIQASAGSTNVALQVDGLTRAA